MHECEAQNDGKFNLHENNYSIGLGLSVIPINYELIGNFNRRISSRNVLDFRISTGVVFYNPYVGGTIGMLLGEKNKFFEINIGTAYLYYDQTNFTPLINIGHRNISKNLKLRVGVGYPTLVYLTLSI